MMTSPDISNGPYPKAQRLAVCLSVCLIFNLAELVVQLERCRSCLGPVVRCSKFKPPTVETVQYCLQAVITVASMVRFAYAAIKIMPVAWLPSSFTFGDNVDKGCI